MSSPERRENNILYKNRFFYPALYVRGYCSSVYARFDRTADRVCDGLPDTTCFRKLIIDSRVKKFDTHTVAGQYWINWCRLCGAVSFRAKRISDYEISRENSEIEIFIYFGRDECINKNCHKN